MLKFIPQVNRRVACVADEQNPIPGFCSAAAQANRRVAGHAGNIKRRKKQNTKVNK